MSTRTRRSFLKAGSAGLAGMALPNLLSLEAAGGFAHARPAEESWVRCLDALHALLEHWPAPREGVSS